MSKNEDRKSRLPKRRKFESIARACHIVGPAAEPLFPPQKLLEALEARFLQEARGNVPQTPAPSPGQVRLEIIDSVEDDAQPQDNTCLPTTGTGQPECSPHGEVLVKLAPGLESGAEVTTRRALAWTHETRPANQPPQTVELDIKDPQGQTQGGSSGSPQNLATAIHRAVKEWSEEGGNRNLILNLSVGWEPIHDPDGTLGEVVQTAIRYAVCHGALVIAAAGNRVSGLPEDVHQPLLPAAWEKVAAPAPDQCIAEFPQLSAQPPGPPNASYTPLVYAVGGVQQDSLPLSNSRPKATPRLVAFGDHAPVGPPSNLKILTGTSVSTLVVSAAAARLWRQNPQLTAFQVMEALWENGEQTGLSVDFCLQPATANCPSSLTARRVFVHPPSPPPRPPWPAGRPKVDDSVIPGVSVQINLSAQTLIVPECDPQSLSSAVTPGSQAQLCPQYITDLRSQPWLGPQPEANHNPACSYNQASPGTLYLEFDPCFRVEGKPASIDDLTLLVDDKAYRLPIESFTLGDPSQSCSPDSDPPLVQIVIKDLEFDDLPHPMYLAVTVNGKHATISPLLQVFGLDE